MIFRPKIKKIEDSFIARLRCSVIGEGMLNEGNIFLIDHAIRNMPENGITFEIGVYGGLSTNLILHLLAKYNKEVLHYGCDAWIYEGFKDHLGVVENHIDGKKEIERTDYMNYIKNSFINATTFLNPKHLPFICHSTSDSFFNNWNTKKKFTDVFNRDFNLNSKIAFCYIDGDHSYNQTKMDFNNVNQKLLIGGYVLIDDSAKGSHFGSAKFISEILKNPQFIKIYSNPNYLFKKVK